VSDKVPGAGCAARFRDSLPLPWHVEDPRLAFPDSERTLGSVRETDASGRPRPGRPPSPGSASPAKGKIAAAVALSLLEVIRARDLPTEILESEDPSQTMPRRLGLSGVVDAQIRHLGEKARRGEKITLEQARDLFHLVLRRPDSEEAFFQAGERLAGKIEPLGGIGRLYPRKIRYSLARRQVRKRVKALFSRQVGGFAQGPFTLEARGHFLLDMDPGGDACHLLAGLSQAILRRYLLRDVVVSHPSCQALKHDLCRWTASE
jgi:hypothetical protein